MVDTKKLMEELTSQKESGFDAKKMKSLGQNTLSRSKNEISCNLLKVVQCLIVKYRGMYAFDNIISHIVGFYDRKRHYERIVFR